MATADTSKFKTAHQLAKELLALPDHPVIIPIPAFDMPGCYTAFPARAEVSKIQGIDVVGIVPDEVAIPEDPPATPDETKPAEQPSQTPV